MDNLGHNLGRYVVCFETYGYALYASDELKDIFMWCKCVLDIVRSGLIVIDTELGEIHTSLRWGTLQEVQ